MILGIKVGPQKESFTDIERADAPFAEVWFNIARADEYKDLFDAMKRRGMQVGLHFWGALPDGSWSNFCYPDTDLIRQTMGLMRQTIDIAARNGFVYVNIHPGTYAHVGIDFATHSFELRSEPIELSQANQLFLEHATALHEHASERGVVFTVETVPMRVLADWSDQSTRKVPSNVYEMPIETLLMYAQHGGFVANDFGHTSCTNLSGDAERIRSHLYDVTRQMAPQTKLIHLGFIVPPYNGTDFHDTLQNPVFQTDAAIPTAADTIELLRIFKNRDDVYVLSEPETDHVGDYLWAKQELLKSVTG